jgi:4-amino-4-deoxy-L-arabinose transferase-like glycosyltransferase
MYEQQNYKKLLFWLIIISALIRAALAAFLDLTNDEVNYWLYGVYPALSYFDHPPMVGYLIKLTTLNMMFDSELFLRLSSVVLGSINIWLIFLIGRLIKDEVTGFYAALLYTGSIYFFVITGIFIQPDTPLVFFWILSIYFLLKVFSQSDKEKSSKLNLLLAGIAIGLGMLGKYQAIYIWVAAIAYIAFYDRKWLKIKELYFAFLISVVCFLPVIIWNFQNDFISFTFQGERVDILKSGLKFNYFFTELFGQIFYNNPVNFILIVLVLFKIRKANFLSKDKLRFLLLTGLPLMVIFLIFSLFRRTLPHWSGPGYISMILIASAYLSEVYKTKKIFIPRFIKTSVLFLVLILVFGVLQINYGIFDTSKKSAVMSSELGRNDVTLDMYGWKQAGEKFKILNEKLITEGKINNDAPVLAYKWYNAGHIDYYMANPIGKKVFAWGRLDEIRNYSWVNKRRGNANNIKEAYYISPSREFKSPEDVFGDTFKNITAVDTMRITRGGRTVENIFVYVLKK